MQIMCYSPRQFLPYGPLFVKVLDSHIFFIRQVTKFYHPSDQERGACVQAVVVLEEETGQ